MDRLLTKINASITAVDNQLHFDKLTAKLKKLENNAILGEEYTGTILEYIRAHSLSEFHCEYLLGILVSVMRKVLEPETLRDILGVLLEVSIVHEKPCEYLLDKTDSGSEILSYLSYPDSFVKLKAVKLLEQLYSVEGARLVATLLKRPELLADLVDMTQPASQEFVRNEALSFLVRLSADINPEVAPILAYQGVSDSVCSMLWDEEEQLVASEILKQGLELLRNLVANIKCSRHLRESGLCDHISRFVEIAVSPILNHARGIASALDDDPDALQGRIEEGWAHAERMLMIADILMTDMENADMKFVFVTNGLVPTLMTVGDSLFLSDSARSRCYGLISHVAQGSTKVSTYLTSTQNGDIISALFQILVDERTPVSARASIDSIMTAVCDSAPEFTSRMVPLLGIGGQGQDGDSQTVAQILTSILTYAHESLETVIGDDSALSQQVWYSLQTLGHIFRLNQDIIRSVLTLRMSERATLADIIVGMAQRHVGKTTVIPGAVFQIAAEWAVDVPEIPLCILQSDIRIPKQVLELASRSDESCTVFLGACLQAAPKDTFVAAMRSVIDLASFDKTLRLLVEWKPEIPKGIPSRVKFSFEKHFELPFLSPRFRTVVKDMLPPIRQAVVTAYLGEAKTVGLDGYLASQREIIDSLEKDLRAAKNQLIDLQVKLTAGADYIVRENRMLHALNAQLREEQRVSESELQRIKVMNEAETTALAAIVDEQQTQVNALLASYNQLSELCSQTDFERDHKDLLGLLETISKTYPETNKLVGNLVMNGNSVPKYPLVAPTVVGAGSGSPASGAAQNPLIPQPVPHQISTQSRPANHTSDAPRTNPFSR